MAERKSKGSVDWILPEIINSKGSVDWILPEIIKFQFQAAAVFALGPIESKFRILSYLNIFNELYRYIIFFD
jgi:hypothetical protein